MAVHHTHLVEGDKLCVNAHGVSPSRQFMQSEGSEGDWGLERTRSVSLSQQHCWLQLRRDWERCGGVCRRKEDNRSFSM